MVWLLLIISSDLDILSLVFFKGDLFKMFVSSAKAVMCGKNGTHDNGLARKGKWE